MCQDIYMYIMSGCYFKISLPLLEFAIVKQSCSFFFLDKNTTILKIHRRENSLMARENFMFFMVVPFEELPRRLSKESACNV